MREDMRVREMLGIIIKKILLISEPKSSISYTTALKMSLPVDDFR